MTTRAEIEAVLANWIGQALTSTGQLPLGTDKAAWVASRFSDWWMELAEKALCDAESAASAVQYELKRLGGWESFGEAMHEHIHLQDALGDLRNLLGLARD